MGSTRYGWSKLDTEEKEKLRVSFRKRGIQGTAKILGSSPLTVASLAEGGNVKAATLTRIREKLPLLSADV